MAPFLHGKLLHSSTSMSQLPLSVLFFHCAMLSNTVHSALNSLMKSWSLFGDFSFGFCLYSHTPLAKPATHVHWYAWYETADSVVESVHVAPFLHGKLLHSSTSMSQLPPSVEFFHCAMLSITVHSALNSLMNSWSLFGFVAFGFFLYSHTPLAKPATHVHWYAWYDTADSVVESVHVAPFWHGLLLHSLISMSQLPVMLATLRDSATVHSRRYCPMKPLAHTPLVKPGGQEQR